MRILRPTCSSEEALGAKMLQSGVMTEFEDIDAAVQYASEWLNYEGVYIVGEGVDGGQPCVVVHASRPRSAFEPAIPPALGKYRVHWVIDTGPMAQ